MAVVPIARLILNVCRVDSDSTRSLLRRLVDVSIVCELSATSFSENLGDSSGESGFPVVDMT